MRLRIRARRRAPRGPEPRIVLKGPRDAELARLVAPRAERGHGRAPKIDTRGTVELLSAAAKALATDDRLDCLTTPADLVTLRVSGRFLARANRNRHPAEQFHEAAYGALEQALRPPLRAALKDHFRWLMVGVTFSFRGTETLLPLLYLIDLVPRLELTIVGRAFNSHAVAAFAPGLQRQAPRESARTTLEIVRKDLATEVSAVVHPMRGLLTRLAPDSGEPMLVLAVE